MKTRQIILGLLFTILSTVGYSAHPSSDQFPLACNINSQQFGIMSNGTVQANGVQATNACSYSKIGYVSCTHPTAGTIIVSMNESEETTIDEKKLKLFRNVIWQSPNGGVSTIGACIGTL